MSITNTGTHPFTHTLAHSLTHSLTHSHALCLSPSNTTQHNAVKGIEVVTGVTYTDIDDRTDIAYFKSIEDQIPDYDAKMRKMRENHYNTHTIKYYTISESNPYEEDLTHGISINDYECPEEEREEFENFLIREEFERQKKECNKDEKVNELYAYRNNCSVTRSLLKSIILNDTTLS